MNNVSSSSSSSSPSSSISSSVASVPNSSSSNSSNSSNSNSNSNSNSSNNHDRHRHRKRKKKNNIGDELLHPQQHHQQQKQQQQRKKKNNNPIIFCDMDGVLVDFDGGISKITNGKYKSADEMPSLKELWNIVMSQQNFFEYLDWTTDGKQLWDSIQHLNPTLLTGVPNQRTRSVGIQKANWCRRELIQQQQQQQINKKIKINHIDKAAHQPQRHAIVNKNHHRWKTNHINIISCWTKFKHYECRVKGSILIDDRYKLKTAWEKAGGIFVHHINTERTLEILTGLGVLF